MNHCFGPTDKVDSANRAGLNGKAPENPLGGGTYHGSDGRRLRLVFMELETKLARLPE